MEFEDFSVDSANKSCQKWREENFGATAEGDRELSRLVAVLLQFNFLVGVPVHLAFVLPAFR